MAVHDDHVCQAYPGQMMQVLLSQRAEVARHKSFVCQAPVLVHISD